MRTKINTRARGKSNTGALGGELALGQTCGGGNLGLISLGRFHWYMFDCADQLGGGKSYMVSPKK